MLKTIMMMNVLGFQIAFLVTAYFYGYEFAHAERSFKKPNLELTQFCRQEDVLDKLPLIFGVDQRAQIDRIVVSKKRKRLYLLSKNRLFHKSYEVAFGFDFLGGAKQFEGDGKTPEGLYFIEMKNPFSSYHKALRVSYPNSADQEFVKAYNQATILNVLKNAGFDIAQKPVLEILKKPGMSADKNIILQILKKSSLNTNKTAGSNIMIHGFPGKKLAQFADFDVPLFHPYVNWTEGCIAVTSDEIDEIYDMVNAPVQSVEKSKSQSQRLVPVEICPL